MSFVKPTIEQVAEFLAACDGAPVAGLEPLEGGYWSRAFAYRSGGRDLVARFGSIREGFEKDRSAMAFDGPDLPIPQVLEVGDAFGGAYAISVRHYGRFLETVAPDEAAVAGSTIGRLLAALHALPPPDPAAPAAWPNGDTPGWTWRRWLVESMSDDGPSPSRGWRPALAADPAADRAFRAAEVRVRQLVEACPERRDVVHGDLLYGNVLITEDASRVTAVYSWKCALRGDFLFDTALCTFWGFIHQGIAAADAWARVWDEPSIARDPTALVDARYRHHCYELQIGASHLGWYAWTGDEANLRATAAHTEMILERGPLPEPR